MAHIIGEAARYTTAQSIRIFQRMLLTTMIVIVAIGIFEGALFAEIILRWGHSSWLSVGLAGMGAVAAFYVCRYQSVQIDRYERERLNFRKGTAGERLVAVILESLPSGYWIINDVSSESGNLDHVVIGPTGVFAIETKNWRGVVAADDNGELLLNGSPLPTRTIGRFIARIMNVREIVLRLTRRDDLFIKGLMVFPKARVEARFGQTSAANCLTDDSLCAQIENPKYARKLGKEEVEMIVRAFEGIAGMEVDFTDAWTAGVKRTHKSENPTARSAIAPYQ